MRYLDPKNDLVFKRIFGEHPHLLKSLLNELLRLKTPIENIEYLPAELVPRIPIFKNSIVDVRCFDKNGRHFIVEMQMIWTDSFKNRVLFNASKAYVKQIETGQEYKGLGTVYSLNLINEIFEPKDTDYYHRYTISHTEHPEKKIEGLEFVFIELPKFKTKNLRDKKINVLWLRFLTEIKDGQEEIPEEFKQNPEIFEATEHAKEIGYTKAQLEAYDRYWDSISTEKTLIIDAYDEGKIEGKIEGKMEGKVEIAKKGILKGWDNKSIIELTDLPIEKIEELKKELKL